MLEEITTHEAADKAFEWQDSRRRPDGHFDLPIQGFMGGKMTLWVPAFEPISRVIIRDGRVVRENISATSSPELDTLREKVIASFGLNYSTSRLTVDESFFQYAVELIKLNYTVTDDDLTELLAGGKWHRDVAVHLCGGEKLLNALRDQVMARLTAERPPNADVPMVDVEPATRPARRWFGLSSLLKKRS